MSIDQLNRQVLSGCYDPERVASSSTLREGLFADTRIFVSREEAAVMAAACAAIERTVSLPAWATAVLADADPVARHPAAARGVFIGVDFHLTNDGPKLIEVNTNAGGAFLNAALLRAQRGWPGGEAGAEAAETAMVEMFLTEWQLQGKAGCPGLVAIVDEHPERQYLYPDFLLCQSLLQSHGIGAVICAPEDFVFDGVRLLCHGQVVDLVYNRLTDFALAQSGQAALRAAWLADGVVLTPHPRAHALYADKRHLVRFGDGEWLASIGVSQEDRQMLARVTPKTEPVMPGQGDDFWARRKSLFFKPVAGYGGKAVYRGQSVTKKVFAEIMTGGYVAQTYAPPSARVVAVAGEEVEMKCDLRCYTYGGQVQLMAARIWQGQTTNFRTPGGGFAPVVVAEE